jgi:hypothetical protein
MKKLNNLVSRNKQKRYLKNKKRLQSKPNLSKQQRREQRLRELMLLNYLSQTAKPSQELVSTDENK